MIKAVAIDDEPKALEVVSKHASRVPFLNLVGSFTDPFKALDYLHQNDIQLVFLDINMPDFSGLEFSRAIQEKGCLVIFTTAFSEHALESYEVSALDYLLKPFEFERFFSAVKKAKERLDNVKKFEDKFCFVSLGLEKYKMVYDQIRYVQGNGNYVTYHLGEKQVLVRSTLKQTLESLPTSDFFQVQRSYIVSLKRIDKIQDNHIYIEGGKISIGSKYKESFNKVIKNYM